MQRIKIYSHNVCWTRRKKSSDIIAAKIIELQPDLVCLQECGFASQLQKLQLDGYHQNYVPLQMGRFAHTLSKVIRDRTEFAASGGLVILSKQKPSKIDYVRFDVQINIFPHALAYLGEKIIQRGFLVAEFEDYYVINVHLTADFRKKWKDHSLKISKLQTNELVRYIKANLNSKKLVITGDFNFTPNNSTYTELDETLDLIDLSNNIPFTYIDKKAKLDYIFTNLKIFYRDNKLVSYDKPPSDHFAILTEISY